MIEFRAARNSRPGVRTACWMLVAATLTVGCATPDAPDATATQRGGQEGNQGWPCDRSPELARHCRLQSVEGFQTDPSADSARFEDTELGATLTARVLHAPAGASDDDRVGELMESWQLALSPAVTWDQDPQGPVGFEVRGISGSERLGLRPAPDRQPRRFHVVTYRNPNTGSILVIEASAPQAAWAQAWPRMAPVFTEVRLTEDF